MGFNLSKRAISASPLGNLHPTWDGKSPTYCQITNHGFTRHIHKSIHHPEDPWSIAEGASGKKIFSNHISYINHIINFSPCSHTSTISPTLMASETANKKQKGSRARAIPKNPQQKPRDRLSRCVGNSPFFLGNHGKSFCLNLFESDFQGL